MTIKDFLIKNQASTIEELSEIIKDIPEGEEPTKEELITMAIELASDASKIYNKGFNEAIALIEKCDSKFLLRKLPPHISPL